MVSEGAWRSCRQLRTHNARVQQASMHTEVAAAPEQPRLHNIPTRACIHLCYFGCACCGAQLSLTPAHTRRCALQAGPKMAALAPAQTRAMERLQIIISRIYGTQAKFCTGCWAVAAGVQAPTTSTATLIVTHSPTITYLKSVAMRRQCKSLRPRVLCFCDEGCPKYPERLPWAWRHC